MINMANIKRRQKIYTIITSIPVASVLYGLPFGALMTFKDGRPFSWTLFVIVSALFGIPMAIIMKRRFRKMFGATPPSNQDWMLWENFKKEVLPTDPNLLRAMPDYLDKAESRLSQSRKTLPTMVIISVPIILFGFLSGSVLLGILGTLMLVMMVASFFSLKKTEQKINNLREKLH